MASQPVDYDALAKQSGAVVDYDALAAQHGAVNASAPAAPQPVAAPSVGGFVSNLGSSAFKFAENTAHAVNHPIDTINAVGNTVEGAANEYLPGYSRLKTATGATPEEMQHQNATIDAFKQNLVKRYGSLDALGHTLYTDPVGTLADLSAVVGGVGGAARGVGAIADAAGAADVASGASRVAGVAQGVSDATNPLSLAVKGAQAVLPAKVQVTPDLATALDPTEKAAVQFGKDNQIPMRLATRTGNPAATNVQHLAENTLGVSGYAKRGATAETQALASKGAQLSADASGTASPFSKAAAGSTPEASGQGVRDELGSQITSLGSQADQSYSQLRTIEADPNNIQTVQTGTKTIDTGIPVNPSSDPTGPTVQRSVPVMQDVALPADLSAGKKLLQPVYDQWTKLMPIATQRASKGLAAIKNVLDADDVMPASEADQNLSALKAAQREAPNLQTGRLLNMAVDQMSGVVDKAVAGGGPDAVDALEQGRAFTKAKYATQDTLDNLRTEPVQLFNQLTYSKDTGVNLLRDVATKAPDAMPAVGRAYLDGLMQKAFAEAGSAKPGTALSEWNNLGEGTKQTLFPDSGLRSNLDNFFTLAKMAAKNPNPSGTAYVGQLQVDGAMLITAPHVAIPYMISRGLLGRILTSPGGAAALANGLKVPLRFGGPATLTANRILSIAGSDAVPRPRNGTPSAPPGPEQMEPPPSPPGSGRP